MNEFTKSETFMRFGGNFQEKLMPIDVRRPTFLSTKLRRY